MLGWWILIKHQAAAGGGDAPVIASWETSIGGTDWLEKLVKEGKATQFSHSGYPNRYRATASDVLPLITSGIPPHEGIDVIGDDYMMPAGWIGKAILKQENFDACLPNQLLEVEVWDMS